MFTPRTATGLTVALLALPATATASPVSTPTDSSGGGESAPLSDYDPPTSGLAGTTSPQDLRSPDAADAARAGDIAKAMERYERSQPAPAAAAPSDGTPVWPEIAFAGVVALATAGGIVRVRLRRSRRVAAEEA